MTYLLQLLQYFHHPKRINEHGDIHDIMLCIEGRLCYLKVTRRKAKIDVAGAVYHIVIRGIERKRKNVMVLFLLKSG
ncbi:MAG: hypothetical protein HQ551_00440 [Desulfobacteraceae bacterium]|nr:hypothetical protein [Desulfobacteraceae bacterium]